jgi:hypothetical protein
MASGSKTATAVPSLAAGGARGPRRWPWLGLGVAAVVACTGSPRPAAPPPAPTASEMEAAEPAAAEPPPPAVVEPRTPAPRVVIEPAEPEPDTQPTLAEAAQRERERRRLAGEPIAVINDANLQDHAIGQLTFIDDSSAPAAEESSGEGSPDDGPDEQYWRDRVRTIRQRWADVAAEVPELEERAAELRRRFYETDDAYYRDSRIKPAWDRAIDLISQARAEAEAHRLELQDALEEGRRAGALPGWLREGVELEPEPAEPEPDGHEPGEPKIVEPVEGGGGW